MVDIDAQSDIYGHRPGADIHSQGGEYGIALQGPVAEDSGVIARLPLDRGLIPTASKIFIMQRTDMLFEPKQRGENRACLGWC